MLTEQEHNLLVAARRYHRRRVYGKEEDEHDDVLNDIKFRIDRLEFELRKLKKSNKTDN